MEIDHNNDITTLGNDIEENDETSSAFGNANEKEADNEIDEGSGNANEKEAENEIDEGSVVQVYCCTMCDQNFSVEIVLDLLPPLSFAPNSP